MIPNESVVSGTGSRPGPAPPPPRLDAYVSHSATLGGESNPEFPIE